MRPFPISFFEGQVVLVKAGTWLRVAGFSSSYRTPKDEVFVVVRCDGHNVWLEAEGPVPLGRRRKGHRRYRCRGNQVENIGPLEMLAALDGPMAILSEEGRSAAK